MATKKTETKKENIKKSETKKTINNDTITGMNFKDEMLLIYIIPFISIVFAFMKDKAVSDKTRFHYNQAATSAILIICFAAFSKIPYIGVLGSIMILVLIIFNIITLVKELKENVTYEIPLLNALTNIIFK